MLCVDGAIGCFVFGVFDVSWSLAAEPTGCSEDEEFISAGKSFLT